ncbi:ISLre2 family transposase, partial [Weizmannia acidilactici]|uniref:ISLre2 family transposase n=3 Tax=Weizmannia acidilactici TaxID=2607726 RepID=UPI00124E88D8
MSKNTIELPNLKEIEKDLFKQLQTYFRVILSHTLEELDVWLMENRDFKRFEYRERQSCTLETLFGPLTFKRRKYKDRQTGRRVALLDQVLKFKGSNSLSPLITDMAVDWAVRGRSYRDARDRITELLDHQAISHESIRQKVLGVKKIDHSTREGHPKKVKALFLEVDGINPSLQGMAQKTHEVKVGMVHEGWEKRHPKSKNYQLVNKSFYISLGDGEEFWEAFSRELYAQYDINEETPIIINGDGASWIRAGVDYFPNAFYNYDRFHLKKWMKAALSNREKKERQKAYKAAEANDP